MKGFGTIAAMPRLYRLVAGIGKWSLRRVGEKGWVKYGLLPLKNWTKVRDLKTPVGKSFQKMWLDKEQRKDV
jgi:hypothetical protein